jgi:outer membrane scaffolding protein for murein synthesis (MipA/OmpV family)
LQDIVRKSEPSSFRRAALGGVFGDGVVGRMRQVGKHMAAAVFMVMSAARAASAQSALPAWLSPSGLWTVSIGGNFSGQPIFEGGKGDKFSGVPIFSLGPAGGSNERFHGPLDSASVALFDYEGLSAGLAGKLTAARTAAKYTELNGLDDVKRAFELGGFVQYFPTDWFRLRTEVRRGFGGHTGVVADFSADVLVPVWTRLTVSGGPRFTLASTRATAPYFSVDAAQSAASGLSVFDAKGGAHSAGAGAQVRYQITPRWEAHAYIEYDRLLGDAAASPLVEQRGSPNQFLFGLGASYAFDFHLP